MAEQLSLAGIRLQDNATFANFFIGKNAEIYHFLKSWPSAEESFVFLWGSLGSGKSHLLQACCHEAQADGFASIFLPFSEVSSMSPQILDDLERLDLVALDDIDAVLSKANWEEALFHLYNRLKNAGKRLIVSSSMSPRELPTQLPDLLSRLMWGLTFHLQGLTDDEKVLTLQMRAKARGIKFEDDIAKFLLTRYSRSMGDLFLALERLDQASLAKQRKLTIPFVKEILRL